MYTDTIHQHTHIHFLCLLFIIYISCVCSDITAWNFDLCSLKPSAQLTSPHLPSSCPFSLPLCLFLKLSLTTTLHVHPPPSILSSPTVSHCRSLIPTSCSPSPSFPKLPSSAPSLFLLLFFSTLSGLYFSASWLLILYLSYPLNPHFSLSHTPTAS